MVRGGLACLISMVLFFEVGFSGSPCYIKLSPWLDCEMFDACWGFYFDSKRGARRERGGESEAGEQGFMVGVVEVRVGEDCTGVEEVEVVG